jgi:hypothetical protein
MLHVCSVKGFHCHSEFLKEPTEYYQNKLVRQFLCENSICRVYACKQMCVPLICTVP